MSNSQQKPKKNLPIHLLAGGVAGCCEALTCHPLDTIKVRLQLRGERLSQAMMNNRSTTTNSNANFVKPPKSQNFLRVGAQIVQNEGFLALYKGLGAVVSGIVPKMAIRFSSFEFYKDWLSDKESGEIHSAGIFLAGLGAGVTESILVVTPMDVIKIRLQAQRHSMVDPLDIPKYRNAAHCALVMIREEGASSLYKGVTLTALRQSTNQAANFTVYQYLKKQLHEGRSDIQVLPWYESMFAGFISGACGPLFNAPIDTIKTRIQKNKSSERGWTRFMNVTKSIIQNEGYAAFYKGLTPRVLRVAPGQAITFMVYENVYKWLVDFTEKVKFEQMEEVGFTKANPSSDDV